MPSVRGRGARYPPRETVSVSSAIPEKEQTSRVPPRATKRVRLSPPARQRRRGDHHEPVCREVGLPERGVEGIDALPVVDVDARAPLEVPRPEGLLVPQDRDVGPDLLSILPLVALFLTLHRFWQVDLTSGAVKG